MKAIAALVEAVAGGRVLLAALLNHGWAWLFSDSAGNCILLTGSQ